ncbi:hypothetical protein CORC01_01391 [Colletotrichum orchidophilum]|uniref:Secreted protein n=1 Tax=Colletotrichum orchidophilum TaxID=1209926 RepID=A0A1G4BPW6_9PEZI|nr:uncharacterized protein CORC01_01391 [Colletotrichum orchidophilum]OHF03338.1 hypothetical protein CORC01_01391 [Colletotrichum orchidophilum]
MFTRRFGCVWIAMRMTSASDWLLIIRHLWAKAGWATFLARGIDTQRCQPPPGTDAPIPNSRLITSNHTNQRSQKKKKSARTTSPCLVRWPHHRQMGDWEKEETGHSRQSEATGHRSQRRKGSHIADPEWVLSSGEVNSCQGHRQQPPDDQQTGLANGELRCQVAKWPAVEGKGPRNELPSFHAPQPRGFDRRQPGSGCKDVRASNGFCALKSPPDGRRSRLG